MPSYGAVDKQPAVAESNAGKLPSAHSYQELDMRFLEEGKTPESDRRRKLISTWVPILVAFGIILIFAKIALVAIGPTQHDPNFPSEFGSKAAPASSPKSYTHSSDDDTTGATMTGTKSTKHSEQYRSNDDTKGSTAYCIDNEACNELELVGLCCPTGEGVMLGCCN